MADDTVRQRKPQQEKAEVEDEDNLFAGTPAEHSRGKKKGKRSRDDSEAYSPWVDILRVLTFLGLASCALSYLISNGESFFWGFKNKPWYLRVDYWKSKINGPLELTPDQLLAYNGSDPDKPIYLAINHTIFDVSANPRIYGPGGSYNVFAGHDASRGFVTGCFLEDRTPDMRGVEDMFLPLDDPEVDRHWTYDEMRALQERELAEARDKVHQTLKHWVDFFGKSDKYMKVGRVVREEGWLEKSKPPKLCDQAAKGRVKRKIPEK
ncbi:cytochrome b5-like Heme/Steroid binding domain-containing protein [Colletotrichum karsti]|uniref:Cytochrome b5-like Heme/Steroid binding domain-containing protein n=1 Tax=Colletotrichum karsti TaxID=1095194 RepID=A0A9P6LNT9_9PEZI|nr:cytochrome b5-like Heme/Steroid binding domain-containing protein [Colletotrichum karsti]KAF9878897.1 cytochrome b5-like Heme/Steroid binding domain-containing protein [Colletotrichum karsti]